MKSERKNRAFTLIELLVVISIISVLSSIILVSLSNARDKAQMTKLIAQDQTLYHAMGDTASGIWNFDEKSGTVINDISGNDNTGSYTGAVWTTDKMYNGFGSALSFNNGNSVVFATARNLPTSVITITAWVRLTGYRNWESFVVHRWGAPGGWTLFTDASGGVYFGIYDGTTQYNALNSTPLSLNTWHFIMGVYDGNTVSVYVDGIKGSQTRTLVNQVLDTTTSGLSIGAGTLGEIDSVRIYSNYPH